MTPEQEETISNLVQKVNEFDKKFYGLFLAGVVFWGAAQYIMHRELSSIDAAIQDIQDTKDRVSRVEGDISLLQYQQHQQDRFNSSLIHAEEKQREEIDRKFSALEAKLYRLYPNNPSLQGEN